MGLPLGSRWSWAVWAVYLLSPFVLGFGPPVVSIHDTYSAPLTYTWQEPLKRTSLVFPSKSRASKRQTQKSQGTLRCDAISYFSDHSPMDSSAPNRLDPQQPIYNVAPLRSMPYIGPPTMHPPSTMPTKDSDATEKVKPAMIFLPSLSTKEERDNILATTKSGVALTGAAALGQVGPIVGLVDIGECKESYLFRVSVPGVSRDESFSCTIEDDGEVSIKGITTTGEQIVCKDSQVFQMQSQNLCPPGHFSISFQLPGSVDPEQFIGSFETDGIFEGIVKKLKDS